MKRILCFIGVLVTLAFTGLAQASNYTSSQIATQTNALMLRRLHFGGYSNITVQTRCQSNGYNAWFCISHLHTSYGPLTEYYNVSVVGANIRWSGTQG